MVIGNLGSEPEILVARLSGRGPEGETTGREGFLLRVIALGFNLLLFFGGKREAEGYDRVARKNLCNV